MAERIADNAEHLVDEMKRRARRRLVGAIVLALGAAIVLPLLLEKEPRPLGDDVSVQIPPIDENKFINRLTGKASESKALPKPESKASAPPAKAEAPATAAPTSSAADAPAPKADAPAPKADAPAPKADAPASKAAPTAAPKGDPKPAIAAASPAPAATSAPAPTPATATTTPTTTAAATSTTAATAASSANAQGAASVTPANAGGFVVQLAAFADDKGANSLANKLKKSGYAAYVQPVETSRGTLWRVRVGGYATRPEADAARATLKGEGYSGITAPAQ